MAKSITEQLAAVTRKREKAAKALFGAWFPFLFGARKLRRLQALRAQEEVLIKALTG